MPIDTDFIKEWGKHYDKPDVGGDYLEYDTIIREVAKEVISGNITKKTFIKILDWKAARVKGIMKLDNFDFYAKGIKKALEASEDDKLSILDDLYGINVPVASTILHFIYPSIFPIMDIRVTEALYYLGYLKAKSRTQKNYDNYRKVISNIAQESKCSIREIDRALFAYHKINVQSKHNICQIKEEIKDGNKLLFYKETEKQSISFDDAFRILQLNGHARIISSRGTKYDVEAWRMRDGKPAIRAKLVPPKTGYIYIHADCWGKSITCQNTRAGGVYNGKNNIYTWLKDYSSI
ncbi:MAG: hypothetical protein O8C62_07585 [Candidatus Methanoperedens sp.]|nr:hypothetical protein [Candidatus Methanoperedens sp.]